MICWLTFARRFSLDVEGGYFETAIEFYCLAHGFVRVVIFLFFTGRARAAALSAIRTLLTSVTTPYRFSCYHRNETRNVGPCRLHGLQIVPRRVVLSTARARGLPTDLRGDT